jgi:hypothetical protein
MAYCVDGRWDPTPNYSQSGRGEQLSDAVDVAALRRAVCSKALNASDWCSLSFMDKRNAIPSPSCASRTTWLALLLGLVGGAVNGAPSKRKSWRSDSLRLKEDLKHDQRTRSPARSTGAPHECRTAFGHVAARRPSSCADRGDVNALTSGPIPWRTHSTNTGGTKYGIRQRVEWGSAMETGVWR